MCGDAKVDRLLYVLLFQGGRDGARRGRGGGGVIMPALFRKHHVIASCDRVMPNTVYFFIELRPRPPVTAQYSVQFFDHYRVRLLPCGPFSPPAAGMYSMCLGITNHITQSELYYFHHKFDLFFYLVDVTMSTDQASTS